MAMEQADADARERPSVAPAGAQTTSQGMFSRPGLCKSRVYALQYEAHDQAGGYQPPVFFGRLLFELEAVGEGLRGLSGFLFFRD